MLHYSISNLSVTSRSARSFWASWQVENLEETAGNLSSLQKQLLIVTTCLLFANEKSLSTNLGLPSSCRRIWWEMVTFCLCLEEMQPAKITASLFLPALPLGILAVWQSSNWEQTLRGQSQLQLNSALRVLEICKDTKGSWWDTKEGWRASQPGWCVHPSFPKCFP